MPLPLPSRPASRVLAALAVALALIASACAARNAASPAPLPSGLAAAALPAPSTLRKAPSYTDAGRQLMAGSFSDAVPANRVFKSGTGAVFTPFWFDCAADGIAETSYCYYAFDLAGYGGGPALTLGWQADGDPAADKYYLALANFARDRWDWFPGPAAGTLNFGALAPYRNSEGLLGAVVLVLGGGSYALDFMRVGPPVTTALPPVAVLQADQIGGAPPLDIHFETALSSDPDGAIALYELDLDGDGTYELSQATPIDHVEHYTAACSNRPLLRVTDGDGLSDTDSIALTIGGGGWAGAAIPEAASAGAPVWNVGGLPGAVACTTAGLSFLRAQDRLGLAWDGAVNIAASGTLANYSATAIGGRPAVAYRSAAASPDPHNLYFAIARDSAGTQWNSPVLIDSSDYLAAPGDPQLFELDGRPALLAVMLKAGVREPHFYLAADASGLSWDSDVVISTQDTASLCAPCLVGGLPATALVYTDAMLTTHYAYVRATAPAGTAWAAPVDIASITIGQVSYGHSLIDAGGRPAMAYIAFLAPSGGTDVYYKRASNAAGMSWPISPVTVYSSGAMNYLKTPRLARIAGYPALAWEEWSPGSSGRLLYARALAADGSSWGAAEEVTRLDSGVGISNDPFPAFALGLSGGLPALLSYNYYSGACLFSTRR